MHEAECVYEEGDSVPGSLQCDPVLAKFRHIGHF